MDSKVIQMSSYAKKGFLKLNKEDIAVTTSESEGPADTYNYQVFEPQETYSIPVNYVFLERNNDDFYIPDDEE